MQQQHSVLLLLTDGEINDVQNTIDGAGSATTGANSFAGTNFDDGFLNFYGLDSGLPGYFTLTAVNGVNWNPAPIYQSYYDIVISNTAGSETASFWDFQVENPTATGYTRGLGSVISANLPANISGGFSVTITTKVSYSASFYPFVFIHALPPTDACNASSDCSGQGSCPLVGLVCECNPGWQGDNCSELVPYCQAGSCMNGGQCEESDLRTFDATNGMFSNLFTCDCNGTNTTETGGNFLGAFCEIVPPCDRIPCINTGAVCLVNTTTNTAYCDCSGTTSPRSANPYTGDSCEISGATPCDDTPCQNGGTCTDGGPGSSASCNCAANGFLGTYCDVPPITACSAPAAANLCGLHGVCVASALSPFTQCICTHGWTGTTCQTEPLHCANKCQNGGQCYALAVLGAAGPNAETYSCVCPAPFVGMHCQWNETQWNSAQSTSAGIFVLLVTLVALLF